MILATKLLFINLVQRYFDHLSYADNAIFYILYIVGIIIVVVMVTMVDHVKYDDMAALIISDRMTLLRWSY